VTAPGIALRRHARETEAVAKEPVEIVREIYERWREGDFRGGADVYDEQAILVMRPQFPDAGTYVGREAIADYTRGFLEPWTTITIEAEEIVPAGDSVLVAVRQRGEGDASGAETEFRYFHLWTFRGESAIRIESIRERDEALEAAGISA
jgi:ketosteroid isomerase-like protein